MYGDNKRRQPTTITMTIKENTSRTINTRNKNPRYIATQDFLLFFNLCVYTIFTEYLCTAAIDTDTRCHGVRVYVYRIRLNKNETVNRQQQHEIHTIYIINVVVYCVFLFNKNGLLWITTQQEWYAMVIERVSILVCTYQWNCVHFGFRGRRILLMITFANTQWMAPQNATNENCKLSTGRTKFNVSFGFSVNAFIHTFLLHNSHGCKAVRYLHVVFTTIYLSVS